MLLAYAFIAIVTLLILQSLSVKLSPRRKLVNHSKLYGGSSIPGGWILAGFKAFLYVPEYIKDGYQKVSERSQNLSDCDTY
jgi:hypothetical protein